MNSHRAGSIQTKAQGGIEYLLILGVAILVTAIVIVSMTGGTNFGKTTTTNSQADVNKNLDILRTGNGLPGDGDTPPDGGGKLPIISAINVVPAITGATITWATNVACDSNVDYGLNAAYGYKSYSGTLVASPHTIIISGLNAGTTYHFRVNSKDASNNFAQSGDLTFTTQAISNTPPIANPQNAAVTKNVATPIILTGSDADGDPLTFSIVNNATNGTLTCAGAKDENCNYRPNLNYIGTDSFTFRANDGTDYSTNATVAITVNPSLLGSANRILPANYTPGASVSVTIDYTPLAGSSAWAVAEYFPPYWVISDVNCYIPDIDDYCQPTNFVVLPTSNRIEWTDWVTGTVNLERYLTYKATPPMGASGILSFTGYVDDWLTDVDNSRLYTGGDKTLGSTAAPNAPNIP